MYYPTTATTTNADVILPDDLKARLKTEQNGSRRSIASRLGMFSEWLNSTERDWLNPDLAAYRDTMLSEGKAPTTVNAHLSTIRSRYDDLLRDKAIIAELDARAVIACVDYGWDVNPANIAAMVDRVKLTLQNALNSKDTRAKEKRVQDRAASEFIRLTRAQANWLLAAPDTNTLIGLRDTALIALALATGARAAELATLKVGDHKAKTEDGALALLIREGKGRKQRLVPYGALDFAMVVVDRWIKHARISEGAILRGFWRGGRCVRNSGLTVVAIENIVRGYPVVVDGESRTVKPHDLRRTYARLAYESGMQPVAIQQNLGHASLDTTLIYIGDLDTSHRQPGAFLAFDLGSLPDNFLV